MFRFENIQYAYGFLLIAVFLFAYLFMLAWKKRAIKQLGDSAIVKQLMPDVSHVKPALKFILVTLAFAFILTGILNPQVGSRMQEVKREGADIMLCLDVSNSMKAEDISPNRLQRAKQAIEKLIDRLKGDRIGIIVFAGNAFVQLPITTDYAAAKLFLEHIDTDMVPTQGTSISKAILLGIESFGKDEGKNRAIVIITDGEDHEMDAIQAAQLAEENNIAVHTVGVGSTAGVPIPIYKNKVQTGFKKDQEGNVVITKLNEDILKQISANGNGLYVRASNTDIGLSGILNELEKLEKKQFESKMYADYDDKFQYFISIALLLICIEPFIPERKSKWFERLNLYGKGEKA